MKPKSRPKKEKSEDRPTGETCPGEDQTEGQPSGESGDDEFAAFDRLASKIIKVPKSEIDRRDGT